MNKIKAQLLHAVGGFRIARPNAYKEVSEVRLGYPVYVEGQLIGRLIDIIGPVRRPYLVIKPIRPMRVDEVYGIEVTIGR